MEGRTATAETAVFAAPLARGFGAPPTSHCSTGCFAHIVFPLALWYNCYTFEVREDREGEYYHLVSLWKATQEEQQLYEAKRVKPRNLPPPRSLPGAPIAVRMSKGSAPRRARAWRTGLNAPSPGRQMRNSLARRAALGCAFSRR
jgi:hypothetical protein